MRAQWNEPQIEAQIALTQAMQQALSRGSLSEILQRPGLNLYREERRTMPLEDVIAKMRHDITVRSERVQDGRFTVSVAFQHTDPELAQKTADALMERLRNELAAKAPVTIQAAGPAHASLEGKRGKLVAMGMLGGLAAGMMLGFGWSVVQNRERWSLRWVGGFAAAGTAVGLVVAFLIPNQYISSAVLRARGSGDPAVLMQRVMSEESLSRIIRDEGLYKGELEKASMADVVRRMKAKRLRVQMVDAPVTAYVISFQDGDPVMAQRGTRALVAAWMRANVETGSSVIEVLDPASFPGSPSYPNRGLMVAMGLVVGLVGGLVMARFGKSRPGGLRYNV
jgi:capsular polysaccharide biosynthesis protein